MDCSINVCVCVYTQIYIQILYTICKNKTRERQGKNCEQVASWLLDRKHY